MTDPAVIDLLSDVDAYLCALHVHGARHDQIGADLTCGGCVLRDRIAAALPVLAGPAPVPPPADRAALRYRIADALAAKFTSGAEHTQGMRVAFEGPDGWPATRMVTPIEAADAVLAVLPEPVDRAAILTEAADALDAYITRYRSPSIANWTGAVAFLRRLAATPTTHPLSVPAPTVPTHHKPGGTMTTRTLPHDPYITAVCDALTAADLKVEDGRTDDCETRGTYCYLNAVITLDPSGTRDLDPADIPANAAWPHGLLLIWEWHTGIEAEHGEPDKGPVWQFAELKDDGSNEYPTDLPVHGYASPAAIVDAVRKVIAHEIGAGSFYGRSGPRWDGGIIGDSWERADVLDAACEAWGVDEAAE